MPLPFGDAVSPTSRRSPRLALAASPSPHGAASQLAAVARRGAASPRGRRQHPGEPASPIPLARRVAFEDAGVGESVAAAQRTGSRNHEARRGGGRRASAAAAPTQESRAAGARSIVGE